MSSLKKLHVQPLFNSLRAVMCQPHYGVQYSNDRERSQTFTSYYNQDAIDAAAAKVFLL